MRALIDLRDEQLIRLDAVAKRRKASRASVVREAVDQFLSKNDPPAPDDKAWLEAGFGLWAKRGFAEDGLAYERRLRDEW